MFVKILNEYKDFIIMLVSSILTLGGAAAGAFFTSSKERKAARRSEIINCYASFFEAYTTYTANKSMEHRGKVVYALEVARLICSRDSAKLFSRFEKNFIQTPDDFASRKDILNEIREQGVREIAKL